MDHTAHLYLDSSDRPGPYTWCGHYGLVVELLFCTSQGRFKRSQGTDLCYQKDVLVLCPRSFDVFLQVGFVVENPKPKQQVEQGLNMDRINEINDWFWNPV